MAYKKHIFLRPLLKFYFKKKDKNMKCSKLCIVVALCGFTVVGYTQTLQEVVEARNKGSELMAAGDLDGAITELEKCIELAKQVGGDDAEEHQVVAESALPNLYLQMANKIYATRDYQATLNALEATVAVAEKYSSTEVKERAEKTIPQIYQAMGVTNASAQNFEDAIINFEQALARDPNMTALYFTIGQCYQNLKDEAKMEEYYRLAIEKGDAATVQKAQTQLSKYFLIAGSNAQKAQKWDEAIAAFTQTLEFDDQNADVYYALGSCYNSKKNHDQAIVHCEKALELKAGADAKALDKFYYELGFAYAGKKDNGKACEYFKKVVNEPYLKGAKYQIETALKCQ